jgi:hypothetical protein
LIGKAYAVEAKHSVGAATIADVRQAWQVAREARRQLAIDLGFRK